jgi:hypothetical protein
MAVSSRARRLRSPHDREILRLAASTLAGLWVALDVLMGARLATLAVRFARGRWMILGAAAA